nr:hypothetical protein B0A51_04763 [Rachicladosporium sp. CCFEE 5018]
MAGTFDSEKAPLITNDDIATPSAPSSSEQPTLSDLQQQVFTAQRAYMRAWSRTTSGKWHRRIMFLVSAFLITIMLTCVTFIATEAFSEDDAVYHSGKVPLEAFIMSKCPDAKDCLHDMILPAMQKISRKVDFKLTYIGSLTDHDDGVVCKHGQEECLGNIIELCAASLYPDPKAYLGFTMCMTNQYSNIPSKDLVEECALEHGMSFDKINECTTKDDGAFSADMLRSSFNRTKEMGVQKSCTVMVDKEVFCIRDGGEWTQCKNGSTAVDLVREVNRLWTPPSWEGDVW